MASKQQPADSGDTIEVVVRDGHTLQSAAVVGTVPHATEKDRTIPVIESRRHGPKSKVRIPRHELDGLVKRGVVEDPTPASPIAAKSEDSDHPADAAA
jgi:hypothetical protein